MVNLKLSTGNIIRYLRDILLRAFRTRSHGEVVVKSVVGGSKGVVSYTTAKSNSGFENVGIYLNVVRIARFWQNKREKLMDCNTNVKFKRGND